jgi:hypothetical protein
MFLLWSLTEQDLLSETILYRLRDTGQGLNRGMQTAPRTSWMMHTILNRAQKSLSGWVGSGLARSLSTWATTTYSMPSCSSVCPPLFYTLPVPGTIRRIRRAFTAHAKKYSQTYCILLPICNSTSLPAADTLQHARAARAHRCGIWLARRALPQRAYNTWLSTHSLPARSDNEFTSDEEHIPPV